MFSTHRSKEEGTPLTALRGPQTTNAALDPRALDYGTGLVDEEFVEVDVHSKVDDGSDQLLAEDTASRKPLRKSAYKMLVAYVCCASAKPLVVKMLFYTSANGPHPITALIFVSFGMSLILLAFAYRRNRNYPDEVATDVSLRSTQLKLCFSAFLELFKNSLSFFSLSLIPAGLSALMQNGMDVAVLSVTVRLFRGRRHSLERMTGILLVIASLVLVGLSRVLAHSYVDGIRKAFLLLFFRAVVNAVHGVIDEELLQDDLIAPTFLAGIQGVFSLFALILIVMPIAFLIQGPNGDSVEDVAQALADLVDTSQGGRTALMLSLVAILIVVAFFDHYLNKLGTANVGTLTRSVCKAARPAIVWIVSMVIFVALPSLGGDGWNDTTSSWQLIGILVQIAGTLCYTEASRPLSRFLRGRLGYIYRAAFARGQAVADFTPHGSDIVLDGHDNDFTPHSVPSCDVSASATPRYGTGTALHHHERRHERHDPRDHSVTAEPLQQARVGSSRVWLTEPGQVAESDPSLLY